MGTQGRRLHDGFGSGRWLRIACSVLLFLAGGSAGAEQLLSGEALFLTRHLVFAASSDPGIDLAGGPGSLDDPVLHGGSLRVLSVEGDVFDATFPLPAARWRYLREDGAITGYRFLSRRGPIRAADLEAGGTLRVFGLGRGFEQTLRGNPAPVRVVLTLGQERYCMRFGGTEQYKRNLFYGARDADAPDVCPLAYGDDDLWLCRPGKEDDQCLVNDLDATAVLPDLSTIVEPAEPGGGNHLFYDCFYVYPTVDLLGPVGNHTDFSDVSLQLDPLLSQAARFRSQCRVFAPLYRQVTLSTYFSPDSEEFEEIAYRDVRDAFRLYLKYANGGRPFVLMGHSQGTFMLTRLIQEEIDPSREMRDRMIVALLIGGSVTVPQGGVVGGSFQNVPLCESRVQTGCAIAYRSYAEGFPPAAGSNAMGGAGMDTACTNPAALGGGEGTFSKTYFPTFSRQPLFDIVPNPGIPTPFVLFPEFYAGECVKDDTDHSYLQIRVRPGPGDLRENPIPFANPILSPGFLGTHILDYDWPLGDLLDLVRTKAWQMVLRGKGSRLNRRPYFARDW